ncbi:hypothetical protein AKJ09_06223 [Labilithrix luteola]|uniref:Outer membrane protein beta-barrel domain-containing protein n=1 Tax=Labilithrix luteola TaxID=1391654 RepID=A0A0K1Q2E7_9BACT|nr:hypothetical protein [Labilithrix luteola]AKU99559.1 hypothetical protein AKJ09_06223 [Labilithrix luteola]
MKLIGPSLFVATLLATLGASTIALAEPLPPPRPPPPGSSTEPTEPAPAAPAAPAPKHSARQEVTTEPPAAESGSSSDAPPPREGFQLALRGGVGLPFGKSVGNEAMSEVFGTQGSFTVDIGGKLGHYIFLGAYLGLGVGGTSGNFEKACEQFDSCTTVTFRIGAQIQYHILPAEKVNPWIGYGIGYEASGATASKNGNDLTVAATGVEFGHFMGGVDFRLNKTFGIGPFVDFSLGQYSKVTSKQNDREITSTFADEDRKLHQWLQLGVRGVFFP